MRALRAHRRGGPASLIVEDAALVDQGELRPIVAATYSLAEGRAAVESMICRARRARSSCWFSRRR